MQSGIRAAVMSCAKRTGARTDTPPLTRLTMSAWCSPIAERLARGGCEANRRRRRVVAPRLKFSGTSLHIARDASVSQVPRRQVRVNYVFILSSFIYIVQLYLWTIAIQML